MVNASLPPIPLPPALEEIRQEIERRAGTPIKWEYDPTLKGEAAAFFDDTQPSIRYRCRRLNPEVVAEELLHLGLTLSGHPRLLGPQFCSIARHAMEMLDDAVQHRLIYPQLLSMGIGFNPYETANRAVSKQLECDSLTLKSEADSLFAHPELQSAKTMADRVVEIIQTQDVSSHEVAIATLRECLSVLGLDNEIAVRFYPDW